jgi:hypothetical protein
MQPGEGVCLPLDFHGHVLCLRQKGSNRQSAIHFMRAKYGKWIPVEAIDNGFNITCAGSCILICRHILFLHTCLW